MAAIPLRNKDGETIAFAQVDDDDAERVNEYRWHLDSKGYPCRTVALGKRRRKQPLHRFIVGLADDDPRVVDHRDHDPLNNCRSNLRPCTRAENAQNLRPRSRPRGVRRLGRRWAAYGRRGGRQVHIGLFDTEDAAADAAATWRERHLPFATS